MGCVAERNKNLKKTGKTKKIKFLKLDIKKYGKTTFDYDINYGTDIMSIKIK